MLVVRLLYSFRGLCLAWDLGSKTSVRGSAYILSHVDGNSGRSVSGNIRRSFETYELLATSRNELTLSFCHAVNRIALGNRNLEKLARRLALAAAQGTEPSSRSRRLCLCQRAIEQASTPGMYEHKPEETQ